MGNTFLEETKETVTVHQHPLQLEEVANDVIHPVTRETITKYKKTYCPAVAVVGDLFQTFCINVLSP